jgi:hypothetical protein
MCQGKRRDPARGLEQGAPGTRIRNTIRTQVEQTYHDLQVVLYAVLQLLEQDVPLLDRGLEAKAAGSAVGAKMLRRHAPLRDGLACLIGLCHRDGDAQGREHGRPEKELQVPASRVNSIAANAPAR